MRKLTLSLVLFALVAMLAQGASFTTLSKAMTATGTRAVVASASAVTLPANPQSVGSVDAPSGTSFTVLYIDGEAMAVMRAGSSSTEFVVSRGWGGTKSQAHILNAKVWVGSSSDWNVLNPNNYREWALKTGIGAVVASATTIALTNPITHVSGTTTIQTITVPNAFAITGGCLVVWPDAAMALGTSGNIVKSLTATQDVSVRLCYDPVAAKWAY